jgi:predicted PurR-regulated permease PerM
MPKNSNFQYLKTTENHTTEKIPLYQHVRKDQQTADHSASSALSEIIKHFPAKSSSIQHRILNYFGHTFSNATKCKLSAVFFPAAAVAMLWLPEKFFSRPGKTGG